MKDKLLIFLKGVAMGAADVVPGVSGGTIAFISGIYERLLNAIKSVDVEAFKLFFSGQFKAFWKKVDGEFLFPLVAGIFTAILLLARLMKYLLANHPIYIWSFFFGLIIASALLVSKSVKKWNYKSILMLVIGIIISYWITVVSPAEAPEGLFYIFLAGSIAICAMILPGISGSFILLLMGQYHRIMEALTSFDIQKIIAFAAGALIGLLSFARLLSFLFKRYHDIMVATLTGFMLGSLNKVWPWKRTLETYTDRHGVVKPLVQESISPFHYDGNPMILGAILFAIVGFFLIWGLERYADRIEN